VALGHERKVKFVYPFLNTRSIYVRCGYFCCTTGITCTDVPTAIDVLNTRYRLGKSYVFLLFAPYIGDKTYRGSGRKLIQSSALPSLYFMTAFR